MAMRRPQFESETVIATRHNDSNGQHDRNGLTIGSRLFSRKTARPNHWLTMTKHPYHCDGNQLQLHPRVISTYAMIGVLFFVSVHLYLYHCYNANVVLQEPLVSNTPALDKKQQRKLVLSSLRDVDREFYTIRINTWKRPEHLAVSVQHHASCPGVKQIQIVWCDTDEEPPLSVLQHPKVVVERHAVNSLNERFHILTHDTPTYGILSIDDDVLRPCEAIDNGFMIWSQHPDRMVGFDARVHVVNPSDGTWKYGYQSTAEKSNQYSLSLPRYCFLHRDYLDGYMTVLPRSIFAMVSSSFNCEDMAMSLFISSLTQARPPLLADFWAIKSMIKLYSKKRISAQKNHKSLRDECVNSFAEQLQVKVGNTQLYAAPFLHQDAPLFDCGDERDPVQTPRIERLVALSNKIQRWKSQDIAVTAKELSALQAAISSQAYELGLIENSDRWRQRWKSGNRTKS